MQFRQCADQVSAGYNSDDPALAENGDAFDIMGLQRLRDCLNGSVFGNRDNRRSHDLARWPVNCL